MRLPTTVLCTTIASSPEEAIPGTLHITVPLTFPKSGPMMKIVLPDLAIDNDITRIVAIVATKPLKVSPLTSTERPSGLGDRTRRIRSMNHDVS